MDQSNMMSLQCIGWKEVYMVEPAFVFTPMLRMDLELSLSFSNFKGKRILAFKIYELYHIKQIL
jgi:hypothetical protein